LRNGEGSTVLLRADMDALPMKENTGLPYASTKAAIDPSTGSETKVAHSCGHDMHVTWLMGVTRILAANKDKWHGTGHSRRAGSWKRRYRRWGIRTSNWVIEMVNCP
jgi:hippurate hydrolase